MDSEPSRVVDEDELRRRFLEKDFLGFKKFLADVEESADKTYSINLKQKDGTPVITVKVRRWKHREVVLRYKLPFYSKFVFNQPLTEEESKQHEAFKAEMVDMATTNYTDFSTKYPEFVSVVYDTLCYVSGLTEDFVENLQKFIDSDFGYNYGVIWFNFFRKTPSEVAELPETDVMLAEALIPKMLARMKPNG